MNSRHTQRNRFLKFIYMDSCGSFVELTKNTIKLKSRFEEKIYLHLIMCIFMNKSNEIIFFAHEKSFWFVSPLCSISSSFSGAFNFQVKPRGRRMKTENKWNQRLFVEMKNINWNENAFSFGFLFGFLSVSIIGNSISRIVSKQHKHNSLTCCFPSCSQKKVENCVTLSFCSLS